MKDVFACLLFTLEQKGWHHLDTWIPPEMDTEIRFAESFGFRCTGFEKVLSYEDGKTQSLLEMRIKF